jgi:hypothetical protein
MSANPPTIGSLAWATQTGPVLSRREQLDLLVPILRTTARYARSRLALALHVAPPRGVRVRDLVPPDSSLARAAEVAAHEALSPGILNHSYRTFAFGTALAQLGGTKVDAEELYVTSLMHDIGFPNVVQGRDFAIEGGKQMRDLARSCGCDETTAERLGDAVARHATPGVSPQSDPLAGLVSQGALLDLMGLRGELIGRGERLAVDARFPRCNVLPEIESGWKAHARALPGGRCDYIERVSMFTTIARLAPWR